MSSGLAAIGDSGQQVGSKRKAPPTLEEQHRSLVDKILKLNNKMGKAMIQLEAKMPSVKRVIQEKDFLLLKAGLGKCRDQRADTMDQLEDLKHFPSELVLQEEVVTQLGGLFGNLTEHCDALQESILKYTPASQQPADIKVEAPRQEGGEAERGSPSKPAGSVVE